MILPTPYSMTTSLELGGSNGSRLVLPVVPVKGAAAPAFAPPQPSEERKDIKSDGFPWPGEWTLERDEANHKATVHWRGKAETSYPWGKETDYENLTYKVDDAHPELSDVRGEAESIFALNGRELRWRGHLSVTTDQKNFLLQVHSGVAERRSGGKAKDVGRNDSERPSVGQPQPGSLSPTICHPERSLEPRARREQVEGSLPFHELISCEESFDSTIRFASEAYPSAQDDTGLTACKLSHPSSQTAHAQAH